MMKGERKFILKKKILVQFSLLPDSEHGNYVAWTWTHRHEHGSCPKNTLVISMKYAWYVYLQDVSETFLKGYCLLMKVTMLNSEAKYKDCPCFYLIIDQVFTRQFVCLFSFFFFSLLNLLSYSLRSTTFIFLFCCVSFFSFYFPH